MPADRDHDARRVPFPRASRVAPAIGAADGCPANDDRDRPSRQEPAQIQGASA